MLPPSVLNCTTVLLLTGFPERSATKAVMVDDRPKVTRPERLRNWDERLNAWALGTPVAGPVKLPGGRAKSSSCTSLSSFVTPPDSAMMRTSDPAWRDG